MIKLWKGEFSEVQASDRFWEHVKKERTLDLLDLLIDRLE